jgi:hypothetical protein
MGQLQFPVAMLPKKPSNETLAPAVSGASQQQANCDYLSVQSLRKSFSENLVLQLGICFGASIQRMGNHSDNQ